MSAPQNPIQRSRNIPTQTEIEEDLFGEFERLGNNLDQDDLETENSTAIPQNHRPLSRRDSFGNHPQNISRDQIVKLYRSIDKENPANEKELLGILNEALKDLRGGNFEDALEAYEAVSSHVAESAQSEQKTESEENEIDNPRPNRTENGIKIYDSLRIHNYEFNANYSDPVRRHQITINGGKVKLNGAGTQDTVEVRKISPNNYEVIFHKNGSLNPQDSITYTISGNPTQIMINAMPQNIQGVPEDDTVLQAGQASVVNWPSASGDLTSKVPAGGEGAAEARSLLEKITDAVNTNTTAKWTDAISYMNGLWPSQQMNRNPAIIGGPALRKALTAIYAYVGNNEAKFKQIMTRLDPQLRREMSRCLQHFSIGTNVYRVGQAPDPANPERAYGQGTMQDGDAKSNEGFANLLSQVPQMQTTNSSPVSEDEEE